jgi:hypothetical protein
MPRAKNDGSAPGWPKVKPRGKVARPGTALMNLAQDVEQRLGNSLPKYHLWQMLTQDQKKFLIKYAETQGNASHAARAIGEEYVWVVRQRERSKSGFALRELMEDVFTLQQVMEGFMVGEVIYQSIKGTVWDLWDDDPKVHRAARKEGFQIINNRLKNTAPPTPVEEARPITLFTPRPVTEEEREMYESRGTPKVVEPEVLERDDD